MTRSNDPAELAALMPGAAAGGGHSSGSLGEPDSVASALLAVVQQAINQAGGWLPFDRFMALALYEPGLGYYANASRKFGALPQSGSDFVTAPEDRKSVV